jgi:hypothetical protein
MVARPIAIVVLVCLGCGCGSGPSKGGSVNDRLGALGFFDYTDRGEVPRVRAAIERDASSGVFALETHRFFFADAEDLAEGGVAELLHELEPTLRRAGVADVTAEDDFADDHYDMIVNGKRYRILSAAEIASDLIWGYAAARTVGIVNDLLAHAGSDEHAYGYQGGNDFGLFLLTPRLRDEVAKAIDSRMDEPYEMNGQRPNFGAPAP